MKTLQVNFLQIRVRGELYDSTLVDIHCGFTHFIFARQKLSSTSEREKKKKVFCWLLLMKPFFVA